ncbi:hypothetical protein ACSTLJ_00020, partial [Vibrio parahaemolyticus]
LMALPSDQAASSVSPDATATPMGRVIAVNGAKCTVLLDDAHTPGADRQAPRAQMGALLAIEVERSLVLAMVCGLSVTSPS